ncbi:MAG: HAMP domain-containing sensor histidine kinase [Bacteroidales bacterium]|nr:HAMP domain-containing sensor histidine kinase [Bacteroidales bacterium]MDT8432495.1 HAMP domain-containing sensor histidine kinase [Bacteroidales bacterium]
MEKKKTTNKKLLETLVPDIVSRKFLEGLIETLPNIVALLDDERRLVYSNRAMDESLGEQDLETAFNLRPGEIFQCVHAHNTPGGCGTSEACEFCGAMRAMQRSRSEATTISSNYRIFSSINGKNKAYNFRFTASPVRHEGNFFYLVTIEDTSDQNRKEELVRIFFHDVMNALGSLHGVINLIREKDHPDPLHMEILESTYNSLFDSISEQKQYSLAASGQLAVRQEEIHTRDLLIEVALPFSGDSTSRSAVEVEETIAEVTFVSDPALLGRVLTNMLKNATEASAPGKPVRIGAELAGEQIRFWVHNQGMIPREVQQQIFERSFSTKGKGRGLGTFSMKLIGETYLNGKVDFSSDAENGTIFMIDLPMHP